MLIVEYYSKYKLNIFIFILVEENPVNSNTNKITEFSIYHQIRMKFLILTTLVGLATAGNTNKSLTTTSYPSSKTTTVTSSTNQSLSTSKTGGSGGSSSAFTIQTNIPLSSGYNSSGSLGGNSLGLSSGSNLFVSSLGNVGSLSSGGLSSIGSSAVFVNSASTGASSVISGVPISTGIYPKADLNNYLFATQSSNYDIMASNAIANALSNTVSTTTTRSLDNIFVRFPNSNQLDALILAADSVGIIRTIQTIATEDSLTCHQRISYLLDFLGRIKAAIEKKKYASDLLRVVIDGAQKQIDRLTAQIRAKQASINALNYDSLKINLNGLLAQLERVYQQFNEVQVKIPNYQAQVAGVDKQIQILVKSSQTQRNRIQSDKLKLVQVKTQLVSIQNRLKDLADRQTSLTFSIKKGQDNIARNDAAIAAIRIKIDQLQSQLAGLKNQADIINSQIKDLQVKTSRVRNDISVNEAKKTRLLNQISVYEDKIALANKRNIPFELTKLRDMAASLRKSITSVQSQIDRHYYYCYGDGKVQVQTTGDLTVYVVRSQLFAEYLRKLYGNNIVVPAVNGNVLFNKVDIFGTGWVGSFGYPFGPDALQGDDFDIRGSFNCFNSQAVTSTISGSGVISAIGPNWIECRDGKGNKNKLSLGSCSRVQSTKKLPAVGQKFYWSGASKGKGLNLHTATCFD